MHNQPQPQTGLLDDFRKSANLMMFTAHAMALPIETIGHRRFGVRYFVGLHVPASVLLILFWPVLYPQCDARPMLGFLVVYLAMLIRARAEAHRLAAKGHVRHSLYSGVPAISVRWPSLNELKVKQFLEPLIAVVIGSLISELFSRPLGAFLVLSGVAMGVSVTGQIAAQRTRQIDLQDAVIDAEELRSVRRSGLHR